MSLIVNSLIFIIGFISGLVVMYCFINHQNMREFNQRQERYKRMI